MKNTSIKILVVFFSLFSTCCAQVLDVNLDPLLEAMEKAERTEPERGIGPLNISMYEWVKAKMPEGQWIDCYSKDYAHRVMLHYWWNQAPQDSKYHDWYGLVRCRRIGNEKQVELYWQKVNSFIKKDTIIVSKCEDMDSQIENIKTEVQRRFHNSYVIMVHGESPIKGVWFGFPSKGRGEEFNMQITINELREKYPKKSIVIWACNPKGDKIKGKNVWHFPTWAWITPDANYVGKYIIDVLDINSGKFRKTAIYSNRDSFQNYCGSIEEMIQGE